MQIHKHIKHLFAFSFLLLFCSSSDAQYTIPEKPKLQTSVYDYIELLSKLDANKLGQKLIRYSDSTSTQIVIVTIASTAGENINYLGANWLTKWGIGQKGKDNGILIVLAKNDKKIAINTGYGVEHLLTDAMSKRIIERDIIPYFKRNDYHGGLNRGVDAIFQVLTGEYQHTKSNNNHTTFPVVGFLILILIFIIFLITISKQKGRDKRGVRGNTSYGASIIEAIILSNMGRSTSSGSGTKRSWGSGSSSMGGFNGGFGGGMGGGGGASGSW